MDDSQPNLSAAPSTLNFQTFGITFSSLAPELKQVFFIGDGFMGTGTGNSQLFQVPSGATRLYLGTMDAFGWYNNTGEFVVEVAAVPLPSAVWLFGSTLGLFAFKRRPTEKT